MVNHSQLSLSGGNPANLSYSLSEDAKVMGSVFDDNCNCIRMIDAGAQAAGQHNLVWDGCDDDGVKVQDGNYVYRIYAVDADGNEVESSETLSGVVDGLILGSEPYISIGGVRVPLSSLAEVSSVTT